MKVILTDEVRGLGGRGEVVSVKDGYARNYLIPKSLAREATAGNIKAAEHERKKWAALSAKEKDVAQVAADKMKDVKLVVSKRAGDEGVLFGSVTASDIAELLAAQGLDIDKRRIDIDPPIKSLGSHEVEVRFHREVTAKMTVEVLALSADEKK